jgi:hypothetical protein
MLIGVQWHHQQEKESPVTSATPSLTQSFGVSYLANYEM